MCLSQHYHHCFLLILLFSSFSSSTSPPLTTALFSHYHLFFCCCCLLRFTGIILRVHALVLLFIYYLFLLLSLSLLLVFSCLFLVSPPPLADYLLLSFTFGQECRARAISDKDSNKKINKNVFHFFVSRKVINL